MTFSLRRRPWSTPVGKLALEALVDGLGVVDAAGNSLGSTSASPIPVRGAASLTVKPSCVEGFPASRLPPGTRRPRIECRVDVQPTGKAGMG